MDRWLRVGQDMLLLIIGNPVTDHEKWWILILAFITCVVVLKLMCRTMGGDNSFVIPSFIASLMGVAVILASVTAAKLYLPRSFYIHHHAWVLPIAGVVVWLLVIAPLTCKIMRISYIGGAISWLVSVLAVAGVIFTLMQIFDALEAGSRDDYRIRTRRDAVEEIFKQME